MGRTLTDIASWGLLKSHVDATPVFCDLGFALPSWNKEAAREYVQGGRTGIHHMLKSTVVRIVEFSARHKWLMTIVGAALMVAAATYDVARFSITTNVEALISQSLPWHQRQLAFSDAFPQKGISAVVRAPTSENAALATDAGATVERHTLKESPDVQPQSHAAGAARQPKSKRSR